MAKKDSIILLSFISFLQILECKLLGRERDGLVEELLASMKHYNTRVDNFKLGILHYKMIQSMSRLIGLPEPPSITKVSLQERDVSLDIFKSTIPYIFFDHFHTFLIIFYILLYISGTNSTTAINCMNSSCTTTQGDDGEDALCGDP